MRGCSFICFTPSPVHPFTPSPLHPFTPSPHHPIIHEPTLGGSSVVENWRCPGSSWRAARPFRCVLVEVPLRSLPDTYSPIAHWDGPDRCFSAASPDQRGDPTCLPTAQLDTSRRSSSASRSAMGLCQPPPPFGSSISAAPVRRTTAHRGRSRSPACKPRWEPPPTAMKSGWPTAPTSRPPARTGPFRSLFRQE